MPQLDLDDLPEKQAYTIKNAILQTNNIIITKETGEKTNKL